MKRLFWLALGAAAGVMAVRTVSRKVERYTPAGLADAIADLGDAVRDFGADVRAGMTEREAELRDALGLDGAREIEPRAAADLTRHPLGDR